MRDLIVPQNIVFMQHQRRVHLLWILYVPVFCIIYLLTGCQVLLWKNPIKSCSNQSVKFYTRTGFEISNRFRIRNNLAGCCKPRSRLVSKLFINWLPSPCWKYQTLSHITWTLLHSVCTMWLQAQYLSVWTG